MSPHTHVSHSVVEPAAVVWFEVRSREARGGVSAQGRWMVNTRNGSCPRCVSELHRSVYFLFLFGEKNCLQFFFRRNLKDVESRIETRTTISICRR